MTRTNFSVCDLCDAPSSFGAMALRLVDGELLSSANYCRQHAQQLGLGGVGADLTINAEHLGDLLDECYRNSCDCLPEKLYRCTRCTRIADVWLTAGSDQELADLERGIELCGSCARAELSCGRLPTEVRMELRESVRHR